MNTNPPNAAQLAAGLLQGLPYLRRTLANVAAGKVTTADAAADVATSAVLWSDDMVTLAASLTRGETRGRILAAAAVLSATPFGGGDWPEVPAGDMVPQDANAEAVAAD